MLSSLTDLILQLSKLKSLNKLTQPSALVFQYILNSFSYIDLNPNLMFEVVRSLHVNPLIEGEADETMKSILREFYKSGLSLSTLFFWDSTDEFYKQKDLKHPMSAKLIELKPNYFLCRIHDFNSVYDIDDQQIRLDMFDVIDENEEKVCSYVLTSFIIHTPGHYICAFKLNDDHQSEDLNEQLVDIKNDLAYRYDNITKKFGSLYSNNFQHTLGCYIRSDLLD